MKRTILLLTAVLTLVMILLAVGCGDTGVSEDVNGQQEEQTEAEVIPDETAPDKDETAGEPGTVEDELIALDEWKAPLTLQELVATFSEIRHTVLQNGVAVAEVHYLLEGSETVDGVQTDKISTTITDETFTVWIDGGGEIRKTEIGGEEISLQMASMLAEPILMNILMPFQLMGEWQVRDILAVSQTEPGVTIHRVSSGQEKIGDLNATVHTFDVEVEPPAVPAGQGGRMQWRVADFGSFQTIIGWEVLEGAGEDMNIEFRIDKVVLR
ncbi:MAG: hypothetical protein SCJ97_01465 [Bacillota bacterium]|nr:hypothetical protein [Bacillota bacterium]